MLKKFLFTALFALWLSGCTNEEYSPDMDMSEEEIYRQSQEHIGKGRYDLAIEDLQAMEARYPFGKYAEQSQLDLIYAYYKHQEPDAAAAAADRFIRLHPQHPNVDYAYYMKGLSSFTESQGFIERFVPTDMSKRDPGAARQSFSDFSQLLSRFPGSEYAPDARKRMIHLRNLLSRYEIHVANYYFKRGAYLAAANRGRYVVENFQQTPAVPDALAVMVQAYTLLGMDDLANDALQVLNTNYPDYPVLDANGNFLMDDNIEEPKRSMLNTVTFGLIDPPPEPGFDTREIYDPLNAPPAPHDEDIESPSARGSDDGTDIDNDPFFKE